MPYAIPNLADAGFAAQAAPDSGDFGILAAAFSRAGVVSGCAVTAQGSPNMTVAVASGVVEIGGVLSVVAANATLTIGTANGTNPRIDLIYTLAAGTPTVAAGTAAANPAYPALPANSVILAAVYVPTSDTTISTNQITDKRVILSPLPGWQVYGGIGGVTGQAAANITAWNAAVSALPSTGGVIYVRNNGGTYYINGNLACARSHVWILGEPGASFTLTQGNNFSVFVLGNLGGSPECTDIIVDGIETHGGCILQDIQAAPNAANNSDANSVLYNGAVGSITNTTNATITVPSAGWTTNQWAGSVVSLPFNGGSLVVTSNTATVLTLTGVFASAPVSGDPFIIAAGAYTRALTSATNTTNAVLTVSGTTWGTTRYVGMYVNFINGPAAGVSKLITAHSNTTVTVSGTYASAPTAGNQFQISTQPAYTSAGWEAVFGAMSVVARDVYRLTVRNCYLHDQFNTGIEIDLCGSFNIQDNTVDNVGLQFYIGGGNGISVIGLSSNGPTYPSKMGTVSNNRFRRVADVAVDLHGDGTYGLACVGNSASEQAVASGGAESHWGISAEIEAADNIPNIGTIISSNNLDGLSVGIVVNNDSNTTQYFAGITASINAITNCDVGIYAEGAHLTITANTMFLVGVGISTNSATVIGSSIERDWVISDNVIRLDPTRVNFGSSGIFLRWQALTITANIATGAITAATNLSPIQLTVPGWVTQPAAGSIVVVTNVNGNTAANGAWVVQSATGTTVTLAQSTGNGTFTTSASSTISTSAHLMDAVNVTGNVLQGQGANNATSTHAGIYVEALSSGTSNSAIAHLIISNNQMHAFTNGIFIQSGGANALISGLQIRGNNIWNCSAWGIQFAGTQIRGTIVEQNTLTFNTSGSITGLTTGAYNNTSVVDAVRNNTGHNPVGLLALPRGSIVATPITTTVYRNDTGYDCTVYILGTITVISVGGNATGLTATTTVGPSIRVVCGQTIAITGSASLSWKWFAD